VLANSEVDVPHVDVTSRDGVGLLSLLRKVVELEARVAHLTEALTSRQQIALITGVLAERTRSNPDEAWSLMVRMSSLTNRKAREVARVLYSGYFGRLSQEDLTLAVELNEHLPPAGRIKLVGPAGRTEPQ
jgi:ANTAR domain